MITVKADGVVYDGFMSASVRNVVGQLCDQFTLTCSADDFSNFPLPRGVSIEFLVGDTTVFEGSVESISGSGSNSDFSVTVGGRDNTKVLVKSSMPPWLNFKGPIGLESVMQKTLDALGFGFEIENLAGTIEPFSRKEILTADVGAGVWDFWRSLAEKRQVLITKTWTSGLQIVNPNTSKYKKQILHYFNDNGRNNVIDYSFDYDDSNRFYEYNIRSHDNFAVKREETPPADGEIWMPPEYVPVNNPTADAIRDNLKIAKPGSELDRVLREQLAAAETQLSTRPRSVRTGRAGVAYDDNISDGSVVYEKAERTSDSDECERIAKWRVNQARVKSVSYQVTVADLIADSEPWQSGNIMDVISEPAGINSEMLLQSVELSTDRSGEDASESASLAFTIPDGYSQEGKPNATQIRVGNIGEKWNASNFQ